MKTLEPKKFYGENLAKLKATYRTKKVQNKLHVNNLNIMPDHILGPPKFWAEFYKQAEALAEATKHSNDSEMFCTFVYEQNNGTRKFVVAHPEVYWWYYKDRPPETRCSYEIIPDGAPCCLYVDLEFLFELNHESNGPRMTNTLIDILSAFMLKEWRLPCNRSNIINLDSTNKEKFSRHLIFAIKDVAFRDNFHVGRFMKYVCMEITNYLATAETQHDILSTWDKSNIEELFVNTKNGRKLFIDTGVYTKNRHFRIYKSTKWAYFPQKKDLTLFDFSNGEAQIKRHFNKDQRQQISIKDHNTSSQYPEIDKYILNIIKPGKIRVCKYNEWLRILTYEICGYRYCENIGRWHKSNNIFLIVDLNKKFMYQKCHDEECSGFISSPKKLPEEVSFQLDSEDEIFMSSAILAEEVDFINDSFNKETNT
ncbi:hypothetical protein KPH14_002719 [Odynerus spinipes]|uniref:DNA-directed primase/polymerase protein n=1 Tax=Odynerus spinipes TaxID=1348599 RepID=A0AAD9VLS9_9HYME|nr:hypothetical protein KPH14_002719 [Odynerus spinipes]